MTTHNNIGDRAYQFFIEEAPELLQIIESRLLTLKDGCDTTKIHEIMRAAHSIKGGAASVGLEGIKNIAHKLEDTFKALYQTTEIDTELESLILEAFDLLRTPLMEQLETSEYDEEGAINAALPVFTKLEEKLGDAFKRADDYIPTSSDLGVDMVSSMFEVDVAEEIARLEAVVANPEEHQVAGELRATIDVFTGFGEMLNLPGFMEISKTAGAALEQHPDLALEITQLTIVDVRDAREAVLQGDRQYGGHPSSKLLALGGNSEAKLDEIQLENKQTTSEVLIDIHDKSYQFFIEEAPELLQIIESELLSLREERSTVKVHEIMRAAHSIKGGAASVGLETIKDIAHSLEDIFKALYDKELNLDLELERQLLNAFDCLRDPLEEQIEYGYFDKQEALAKTETVFGEIIEKLRENLEKMGDYLPSANDLGVDIVSSIFEIDIAESIQKLEGILEASENPEKQLENQLDVLKGFGELLNLPGFSRIVSTASQALATNPHQALEITSLLISDLQNSREIVLQGDREKGGEASEELKALVENQIFDNFTNDEGLFDIKEEEEIIDTNSTTYQFFIEEAPELLKTIELGLLSVKEELNIAKVHEIMRCAHSLKGGAASVGLETIKQIAHKLEDIFKILYDKDLQVDTELENDLLKAYDCLRQPLQEQIDNGSYNQKAAKEYAEPIFAEIEEKFTEVIKRVNEYIPSSSDLGVDIVASIFEIDVAESIKELESILENPENQPAEKLKAQLDVLTGFGEMLSLNGFSTIVGIASETLAQNSQQALDITKLLISDLQKAREAVLAGDRISGGNPSEAWINLVQNANTYKQEDEIFPYDENLENCDINGDSYQFFIEEAPELLENIASGLVNISEDKSKIHEISRSAHSLKGNSATVGLEAIRLIALRLEKILKALAHQDSEISKELENQLFTAYECLRKPLEEQIQTGSYHPEAALAEAKPIIYQIHQQLGDAIKRAEDYIPPSSSDLGIDIVSSIFDIDVAQEIENLQTALKSGNNEEIAEQLTTSLEMLGGFGEMLNLPGFSSIISQAQVALEINPHKVTEIAQITIEDLTASREVVLEGDRQSGGNPSEELMALAESKIETQSNENTATNKAKRNSLPSLEDVFGGELDLDEIQHNFDNDFFEIQNVEEFEEIPDIDEEEEENPTLSQVFGGLGIDSQSIDNLEQAARESEIDSEEVPLLEDVFGTPDNSGETNLFPQNALEEGEEVLSPSLEDVFGDASIDESTMEKLEEAATEDATEDTSSPELETPSLEDVFGEAIINPEQIEQLEAEAETILDESQSTPPSLEDVFGESLMAKNPNNLQEAIQSLQDEMDVLPTVENLALPETPETPNQTISPQATPKNGKVAKNQLAKKSTPKSANLSVRVDLDRLERMNNLVGELSINRNSLSLQNDKLQNAVKELLSRFDRFQQKTSKLREMSDQMLISPDRYGVSGQFIPLPINQLTNQAQGITSEADFDSLEMDTYGGMYSILQDLLEEIIQVEEAVDDIALFAKQSGEAVDDQRQMLNGVRDELMWARMLPLGEVLNRFPRVIRDLSIKFNKNVSLKLTGTGVLVDKAALEKLYDPLMHLIRNAFDHGIEPPQIRKKLGKPEQGKIEVRAYHQGNQTIIEINDDGSGLNLEKIGKKAVEKGLISQEQQLVLSKEDLLDLIFQPGFSTASQVSELSGRGVGLDVVRSQLQSLKGTISVDTAPEKGTTFMLQLPLTLTIDKLLVCLAGTSVIALPSDSIAEIIVPEKNQIKSSGNQRFLKLEKTIMPINMMSELLDYRRPITANLQGKTNFSVPTPKDWGNPLIIIRRGQQLNAVEVDRLVTEQELVIKPFGSSIAPPPYIYGCTLLGDGTIVPVINGSLLLDYLLEPNKSSITPKVMGSTANPNNKIQDMASQNPTILAVDDSAAMRRTLALSLEKAGYRVLQAKDGREALQQLEQSSNIQLVICDIEMPNMNGFEFLGQRRRQDKLLEIPVAMLTSRSNDKHRKLATHLGADAYFTKPYIEQKFLESIQTIIKGTKTKQTQTVS